MYVSICVRCRRPGARRIEPDAALLNLSSKKVIMEPNKVCGHIFKPNSQLRELARSNELTTRTGEMPALTPDDATTGPGHGPDHAPPVE